MRIPALLTSCILIAPIGVSAQDLQYRSAMSFEIAGSPMQRPVQEITFSIKNKSVRMDMNIGDGKMTTFVDYANRKMIVLMPTGETMEHQLPAHVIPDSATATKVSEKLKIDDTGERTKFLGYDATRLLVSMKMDAFSSAMPGITPPKEGEELVSVIEAWIATDTLLTRIYDENIGAFSGGTPIPSEILAKTKFKGFPLRMTMVMGSAPSNAAISANDVIQGKANGFSPLMRMVNEVKEIKTAVLDPALFVVPKDSKPKQ